MCDKSLCKNDGVTMVKTRHSAVLRDNFYTSFTATMYLCDSCLLKYLAHIVMYNKSVDESKRVLYVDHGNIHISSALNRKVSALKDLIPYYIGD